MIPLGQQMSVLKGAAPSEIRNCSWGSPEEASCWEPTRVLKKVGITACLNSTQMGLLPLVAAVDELWSRSVIECVVSDNVHTICCRLFTLITLRESRPGRPGGVHCSFFSSGLNREEIYFK